MRRKFTALLLYLLKNFVKNSDPCLKQTVSGFVGICDGKNDIGCSNNVTLQEYTRYWVQTLNHGGLICVTDDFYKFITKTKITYKKF